MALAPVQIFSPDPGKITDFTKVPVADIFNNIVAPRVNSLMRQLPEEEEEDPYLPADYDIGLMDEPPLDASSLFAPEEGLPPVPTGGPQLYDPMEASEGYDLLPTPEQQAAPRETPPGPAGDFDPAEFTFSSEARRDSQGRLKVYVPPSGDGGGAFEVAGITARYQPKEASRLRSLIQSGRHDEAEAMAKEFYRKRAEPFIRHTNNPGLQLQLTDTVHHRGEGGLRRILQRATGSRAKSYDKLISQLSAMEDPLEAFHQARQSYEWEEVDRGRGSRRKFRQGLQNRFNKANEAARKLIS